MRADEFSKRKVVIPDNIVDTESNLKPVVLRKNLYRLGFPHDKFRDIEGHIDRLLNYRNGIAHGDMKMIGIMQDKYEELRSMVFKVINEIKRAIMQAIQDKEYLK